MKKWACGFSLLEMLIVLAIAATLAAMAHAGYTRYAMRLRRVEGQTALMDAMQQLERHALATGTYGDGAEAPEKPWTGLPATSPRGAYRLSVNRCPDAAGRPEAASFRSCVRLQAEPRSFDDADCGTLVLHSDGWRGTAHGEVSQCW